MRAAPQQEGRLKAVTFFVDRSIGQETVATALKARGANVERHDDHFPQDARDHVWLSAVGAKGWVVISKDRRIRYRGAERAAVWSAGVALFIFRGGNMRSDEIAAVIANALDRMLHVVQTQSRPFIATIAKSGTVRVIDPAP